MKKLKYFVIHCTDTPAGKEVTSDDIKSWHLSPLPKGRGWKQIGYTDIIHLDGKLEQMVDNNNDSYVDPWEITNGVAGINPEARHIVLAGGSKGVNTFTPEQMKTLERICKQAIIMWPTILIAGHRQFDKSKTCPSFDVPQFLLSININKKNIYQT
jgi:hypothetical protein